MGVPVRHQRDSAVRLVAARVDLDLGLRIWWASSRMMRRHLIEWRLWSVSSI